ncbi:hypothetical protein EYY60_03305 [Flavobacterium zhairuonense]|uniref:hypothetical protein n=1 Tax=Flavobacterium zhairuonense TaxID=2493631 RepID=UPI0010492379|nr:hypothetical protein [Flavobacterium zhairuonense]KAF2514736.1 hypothetical protein EYY60_03305 [Flavobacterium zhairuonense]
MPKFSIFIKSNKFYWSPQTITYSTLFFICGVMLFKQKVLNLEHNLIDEIFGWFAVSTFMFGIILKFYNSNKIEPLRGKLEGYLSFEKEAITVGNEIYPLEKIRKIKISNDDYVGRLAHISSGNLGPALSNGTNNFLILFFESSTSKRYAFELINSDDFQKVRETLIDYYLIGKIDYWELAYILGEKSTSEIRALNDEINKKRTINHLQ